VSRAWRFIKSAVATEVAIWRCLVRWIARRPDVPAGATKIGYAQLVTPMLWVWILASGIEVVAVELVLRTFDAGWAHATRLSLLVLGIWGQLWMLGLLASYRVRPHLLHDDRLEIRVGPRTWVQIPLDSIASIRAVEHELESTLRSTQQSGGLLLVGVSRRTNLELALTGPTTLDSLAGEVAAERVGLWVDEPRVVAGVLRTRITAAAQP
jgi:hypothetical protein